MCPILKVSFQRKDYFFGHFPEMLSLALLLCYHAAYGKSKNKIDVDFKQNLVDMTTEWTTGFRASKKLTKKHWVMQYDLQEGGKNPTQDRLKQMDSAMSPGTSGSRTRNVAKAKFANYQNATNKQQTLIDEDEQVRHTRSHTPTHPHLWPRTYTAV